jgi:hypothetical protein
VCPECSTPIARSLQGNLLRFADPAWLNKLRLGVALKLWMLLIALVVGIGGAVFAAIGLFVVQAALNIISGLLGLWAIWLITAPEPNIAVSEDPMSLRRLLRTCAVIGFFGGQTHQILAGVAPATVPGMAPGAMPGTVLLVALAVMMLIGLVATFGEFVYFRRFARRVPDQKLADNTTVVMWGYSGAMALVVIAIAIAAIVLLPRAAVAMGGVATGAAPAGGGGTALVDGSDVDTGAPDESEAGASTPGAGNTGEGVIRGTTVTAGGRPTRKPPGWAVGIMAFLGCGVVVGMLVFGIWYIGLLIQYYGVLRKALTEAQQLGESQEPQPPL